MAEWLPRVAAALLDGLVVGVPGTIAYVIFLVNIASKADSSIDPGPDACAVVVLLVGVLATIGLWVWNRVFRQGTTGQSVGKSVLDLKLIDAKSFQPIGPGRAFLRDFLRGIFDQALSAQLALAAVGRPEADLARQGDVHVRRQGLTTSRAAGPRRVTDQSTLVKVPMMNRSATACGVTDAGWSGLRSSG